jgi:RNA polymerase sigma factor (TIGR02999 family)
MRGAVDFLRKSGSGGDLRSCSFLVPSAERRVSLGTPESQEITELLAAWGDGDQSAFERLVPLVYAELKRMARRYMYRESEGHLLQTTALVHEAYLKLVSQKNAKWQNRAQFFAVSSQQMRRILVDAARSRLRQKRGSDAPMVSLEDAPTLSVSRASEWVALDDALRELAELDPRRSRVVEMRYFGGMSVEETATALSLSVDTVMRDWKAAKAWLYVHLGRAGDQGAVGKSG